MKKSLAICLLVLLIVGCGGDPDEQANKLFVEALQLIESAESKAYSVRKDQEHLEKEKLALEVMKDYEKALSNIQKIIDDYSKSDLAVKLITKETLISGSTLAEHKRNLTEMKESLAGGESIAIRDEKPARIYLQALSRALDLYQIDMNSYPDPADGLNALQTPPLIGTAMWGGPYLKKAIPPDPWGQPYYYQTDFGDLDQQVYTIWSSGPNMQNENGEGDDIAVYSDR